MQPPERWTTSLLHPSLCVYHCIAFTRSTGGFFLFTLSFCVIGYRDLRQDGRGHATGLSGVLLMDTESAASRPLADAYNFGRQSKTAYIVMAFDTL